MAIIGRVRARKAPAPSWDGMILVLLTASLMLGVGTWAQSPREVLLTDDNAYNPMPSPDGTHIAYVRTGWGNHGMTGLGRGSLVSEIKVLNAKGAPNPKVLAEEFFLSGWTPDSTRVVCYRDWRYALVSTDGKQDPKGEIPIDLNRSAFAGEWVAYAPSLGSLIWSRRSVDGSHRVIETPDHIITQNTGFWAERVVPSPDGRYLAIFRESSQPDLKIYNLQLESWTDLGPISIHPDENWSFIQPDWNPWFADGSHLVFARSSAIVIAEPDGTTDAEISINGRVGLPTASPDGKLIAFETFEPRPMGARPDLDFWGSTTIWVVPLSHVSEPHPVTTKNPDEVLDLKWLTNDILLFDRVADEPLYTHARIWKITIPR